MGPQSVAVEELLEQARPAPSARRVRRLRFFAFGRIGFVFELDFKE